jgi:hypothetical protein
MKHLFFLFTFVISFSAGAAPTSQVLACRGEFEDSFFEIGVVEKDQIYYADLRESWGENFSETDELTLTRIDNEVEQIFIQLGESGYKMVEYLRLEVRGKKGSLYMSSSPSELKGFQVDVECIEQLGHEFESANR